MHPTSELHRLAAQHGMLDILDGRVCDHPDNRINCDTFVVFLSPIMLTFELA